MYSVWTKHLKDEQEKQSFEYSLAAAKTVFKRLLDLLNEKEQTLDRSELSLEAYDKPEWAYRQAHKNGYRSCLRQLQTLITLDPEGK